MKTPQCAGCYYLAAETSICSKCPHLLALASKHIIKEQKKHNGIVEQVAKKRNITKAEITYGVMLQSEFPGYPVLYEALKLKLRNGHTYTPDWVVHLPDRILCVEVKVRGENGFRQASYGRSIMAYHQAIIDWPMLQFRWAEKYKGEWLIKASPQAELRPVPSPTSSAAPAKDMKC